jgi:cell pole-organizing protein PopZ
MNATSAAAAHQTLAEQRSHEPSMEEILASIRRIIADDHVLPLSRSSAPPRASQPEPQEDHRAYEQYDSAPQARQPLRHEPQRTLRPPFRMEPEPMQRMAAEPPMRPFEAPPARHEDLVEHADEAILSRDADTSVSSSFNALATSVMLQNSGLVEDSVRELLRPMLKSWLDDNLPGIVERLVRQEIERMARGRR